MAEVIASVIRAIGIYTAAGNRLRHLHVIHARAHARTHTHTHARTHVRTHVRTHTHTHTNTRTHAHHTPTYVTMETSPTCEPYIILSDYHQSCVKHQHKVHVILTYTV